MRLRHMLSTGLAAAMLATTAISCTSNGSKPAGPGTQTVAVAPGVTVDLPAKFPAVSSKAEPSAASALTRPVRVGGRNLLSAITVLATPQLLTTSAPLPASGVILSFHVTPREVPSRTTPFLASLDTATGKWVPVATHYDPVTGEVSARITHFSIWAPLDWIKSRVTALFKGALLSLFSLGGTGSAPSCNGNTITVTDSKPNGGIGACAQEDGAAEAVAKIVNERPYPIDLLYPAGATINVPSADPFAQLGAAINNLASNWHDRVLLPGGAEADATVSLPVGERTGFITESDGEALLLGILGTAVRMLVKISGGLAVTTIKALIDALDQTTCLRDAVETARTSDLSLATAQSIGSEALDCLSIVAKGVGDVLFTVASIVAALAVELVSSIWGAIDNAIGNAYHQLTLQRPQATPHSAYLGWWHAHDYELCIGQALDLTSATATSNPPCNGDSTSGWERMWGCGYPSGGCGFAWIALTFAYRADGTVTAMPSAAPVAVPSPYGGSFYDEGLTICTLNGTGNIVPCNAGVTGIPPEGLTPGSQQLSLLNSGVLKVTLPQGYWGGASYEVCGQSASQAEQQHYCPNG